AVATSRQPQAAQPAATAPPQTPRLTATELEMVALVADHPYLVQRMLVLGALKCIGHRELREALMLLGERTDTFKLDVPKLADSVDPQQRPQIMEAALSGRYADVTDPEKALLQIIRTYDREGVLAEAKKALAQ